MTTSDDFKIMLGFLLIGLGLSLTGIWFGAIVVVVTGFGIIWCWWSEVVSTYCSNVCTIKRKE